MDSAAEREVVVALAQTLPARLPNWLATRRWYADKGRVITRVVVEDVLVERVGAGWLALTIARLDFADGSDARYFLPLAFVPGRANDHSIAVLETERGHIALVDATAAAPFGPWLLDRLGANELNANDRWQFVRDDAARAALHAASVVLATVSAAEQSNSSLRFGDVSMVKLVRRLQPGPNPDEETLRALAAEGFSHVPRYLASANWRSADGGEYPIALAQAYVANEGDGWSWTLARLAALAAGAADFDADAFAPERLLGRRTGELHAALARIAQPAFAPESATEESVAYDIARTRAAIASAVAILTERAPELSPALRDVLPVVTRELAALGERASGYERELGTQRIRVHGDYHLGQTLRSPDGDWTIIDFEGEPARSVAERRAKTSVLKDVAGMLRSFAYARGVAERERPGDTAMRERLRLWEEGARRAFLDGYREALQAAPMPLVPADPAAFAAALAAWELDKALYEIAYEARNRPDWLAVPLRALLPRIDAAC